MANGQRAPRCSCWTSTQRTFNLHCMASATSAGTGLVEPSGLALSGSVLHTETHNGKTTAPAPVDGTGRSRICRAT